MGRLLATFLALLTLGWASPALADVQLSFHSFNGSVLVGRYPHTFIVLEGELENGQKVNENYGFTAKSAGPAVLNGPVEHDILIEKPKYISSTNRHFTVTITDAQYRKIVAEMKAWRDAPGKYYDLDTRNCIHFVGAMAQIVGLKVEYPKDMLRRPKKWLNYITSLNPSLGARTIK
ncbi:hypothetical protein G6N82_07375 [Altererythrobacter sp. BO-6]|uniref:hypothetical protein n=1 Tax=Altererythrobacter sp. BO-6 TaxID=2604537 RepID=UPI0013E1834E|nr:hypothetical protein [Altererythrobacter sp. BO-6]QIG53997.1 hypothetical protein G6N82_07375 [Altererythrobacter sp. BO-6]